MTEIDSSITRERLMATRSVLRRELVAGLPTSIMTIATSASFVHVFGSWNFMGPLTSVAVLAHLLCAVARTIQVLGPPVLSAPVALIAPVATVYCSVGWIRFPETLWFGLPMSRTWESMWIDLRSSIDLIGDVVTPVEFSGAFGTLSMAAVGFVAVATDAFAARYGGRVEVFVPAAATLFVVAAVGTEGARVPTAALWIAAAFACSTWIRRNHIRSERGATGKSHTTVPAGSAMRSTAGAVLFAAVVAVVAAIVGPALPGAGEEAWLTQRIQGAARELEPLVDVRRQLSDPSPAVLFTVRADSPSYWRVSTLADFDGSRWTISERLLDAAAGELFQPIGAADPGVEATTNFQKFTIENLAGGLAPVAPSPTRLRASTQSLFYEPTSGSLLVGEAGLRPQDSYEIQSTMIAPLPERLARATSNSAPNASYLDVPEGDSTDRLRDFASSIANTAASPYEQALALQNFFRTEFTYSLDVPPIAAADATIEFLERRTGYCEHFASTFALFARMLGIPARVAVGFTPGDRSVTDSGASLYSVRSMHAHAWPEVWFDELGWILFEPTPGRGAPNSSHTNVPEEQSADVVAPETTTPSTTSTTTPAGLEIPTDSVPAGNPQEPVAAREDAGGSAWPWIAGLLLAACVSSWVFLLPLLLRSIVQRRSDSQILGLWRRAVALYELERGRFDASLSPREVAAAATSRLYDDDTFIFELAELATSALFADPDSPADEVDDIEARGETYLRDRRRRMPAWLRLRARIDPILIWRLEGGRRN